MSINFKCRAIKCDCVVLKCVKYCKVFAKGFSIALGDHNALRYSLAKV